MLVSAISLFGSAIHPLELVLNRGKHGLGLLVGN